MLGVRFSPDAVASILEKSTVAYRRVDGQDILADVYCPNGNAICPVIIYIHGGALIMGNRQLTSEYQLHARVMSIAEQGGYAIVSID